MPLNCEPLIPLSSEYLPVELEGRVPSGRSNKEVMANAQTHAPVSTAAASAKGPTIPGAGGPKAGGAIFTLLKERSKIQQRHTELIQGLGDQREFAVLMEQARTKLQTQIDALSPSAKQEQSELLATYEQWCKAFPTAIPPYPLIGNMAALFLYDFSVSEVLEEGKKPRKVHKLNQQKRLEMMHTLDSWKTCVWPVFSSLLDPQHGTSIFSSATVRELTQTGKPANVVGISKDVTKTASAPSSVTSKPSRTSGSTYTEPPSATSAASRQSTSGISKTAPALKPTANRLSNTSKNPSAMPTNEASVLRVKSSKPVSQSAETDEPSKPLPTSKPAAKRIKARPTSSKTLPIPPATKEATPVASTSKLVASTSKPKAPTSKPKQKEVLGLDTPSEADTEAEAKTTASSKAPLSSSAIRRNVQEWDNVKSKTSTHGLDKALYNKSPDKSRVPEKVKMDPKGKKRARKESTAPIERKKQKMAQVQDDSDSSDGIEILTKSKTGPQQAQKVKLPRPSKSPPASASKVTSDWKRPSMSPPALSKKEKRRADVPTKTAALQPPSKRARLDEDAVVDLAKIKLSQTTAKQKYRSPTKTAVEEERLQSTTKPKAARPSFSKMRIADSSENDELASAPDEEADKSEVEHPIRNQSQSPKASRPPSGSPERRSALNTAKEPTVLSDTSDEDPSESPNPTDQYPPIGSDMDLDVANLPDLPAAPEALVDSPTFLVPDRPMSADEPTRPAAMQPADKMSTAKAAEASVPASATMQPSKADSPTLAQAQPSQPLTQQADAVQSAQSAPSSSQSQPRSTIARPSTMLVAVPERRKLGHGKLRPSISAKDRLSPAPHSSPQPSEKAVPAVEPARNEASASETVSVPDPISTTESLEVQARLPNSQATSLPVFASIQQGDKLKPIEIDEDDDDLESEGDSDSRPFVSQQLVLRRQKAEDKLVETSRSVVVSACALSAMEETVQSPLQPTSLLPPMLQPNQTAMEIAGSGQVHAPRSSPDPANTASTAANASNTPTSSLTVPQISGVSQALLGSHVMVQATPKVLTPAIRFELPTPRSGSLESASVPLTKTTRSASLSSSGSCGQEIDRVLQVYNDLLDSDSDDASVALPIPRKDRASGIFPIPLGHEPMSATIPLPVSLPPLFLQFPRVTSVPEFERQPSMPLPCFAIRQARRSTTARSATRIHQRQEAALCDCTDCMQRRQNGVTQLSRANSDSVPFVPTRTPAAAVINTSRTSQPAQNRSASGVRPQPIQIPPTLYTKVPVQQHASRSLAHQGPATAGLSRSAGSLQHSGNNSSVATMFLQSVQQMFAELAAKHKTDIPLELTINLCNFASKDFARSQAETLAEFDSVVSNDILQDRASFGHLLNILSDHLQFGPKFALLLTAAFDQVFSQSLMADAHRIFSQRRRKPGNDPLLSFLVTMADLMPSSSSWLLRNLCQSSPELAALAAALRSRQLKLHVHSIVSFSKPWVNTRPPSINQPNTTANTTADPSLIDAGQATLPRFRPSVPQQPARMHNNQAQFSAKAGPVPAAQPNQPIQQGAIGPAIDTKSQSIKDWLAAARSQLSDNAALVKVMFSALASLASGDTRSVTSAMSTLVQMFLAREPILIGFYGLLLRQDHREIFREQLRRRTLSSQQAVPSAQGQQARPAPGNHIAQTQHHQYTRSAQPIMGTYSDIPSSRQQPHAITTSAQTRVVPTPVQQADQSLAAQPASEAQQSGPASGTLQSVAHLQRDAQESTASLSAPVSIGDVSSVACDVQVVDGQSSASAAGDKKNLASHVTASSTVVSPVPEPTSNKQASTTSVSTQDGHVLPTVAAELGKSLRPLPVTVSGAATAPQQVSSTVGTVNKEIGDLPAAPAKSPQLDSPLAEDPQPVNENPAPATALPQTLRQRSPGSRLSLSQVSTDEDGRPTRRGKRISAPSLAPTPNNVGAKAGVKKSAVRASMPFSLFGP